MTLSPIRRAALPALALGLLLAPLEAAPARRGRGPAPAPRAAAKLTDESVSSEPTAILPEADARRFGYGNGIEVHYTKAADGHHWKLNEPAASDAAPAADATEQLKASSSEEEFNEHVATVRPTFVTLVFTDSPDAAKAMIDSVKTSRANTDEIREKTKLSVLKLDADPRLDPATLVYNREFNLGDKNGGMRRASAILVAKGNVFLRVDAMGGLKDGQFELEEDTLEKRAREVATYLLRKL